MERVRCFPRWLRHCKSQGDYCKNCEHDRTSWGINFTLISCGRCLGFTVGSVWPGSRPHTLDFYHSCQTSLRGEILPNRSRRRGGYICLCHYSGKQNWCNKRCREEPNREVLVQCSQAVIEAFLLSEDTLQEVTNSSLKQEKGCLSLLSEGTDQINHSFLRAAEIKGKNSPVLYHNLFFSPIQRCHAWPRNHMWASKAHSRAERRDNKQPVILQKMISG